MESCECYCFIVRVIRRNISIFLSVTLSKRNYIELIHYTVQPQLIGQKKKKNLIRKKKRNKKGRYKYE